MSLLAAFGAVAVALVVLLFVSQALIDRLTKPLPPAPIPETWGDDPEDLEWEAKAKDYGADALEKVQETAKAWSATLTALLGVGGTVAVVKGTGTLSDLSETSANLAFWLIVAAGLTAAAAIVLSSLAASGTPRSIRALDGFTLKKAVVEGARKASVRLLWARALTFIAAISVFVAAALSWGGGLATESKPSAVIAADDQGTLRCGTLASGDAGEVVLRVGEESYAISPDRELEDKASCPPEP